MDTYIIASLLLTARVISAMLLFAVIVKQVNQIRRTATHYPALRMTLMLLTVVFFIGQFVPIYFDSTFAISEWGERETPNLLIIAYTATNASTALIASTLLYIIYYRQGR